MDLHSGTLYWPSVSPGPPPADRPPPEIECDALIIGGGVTGAMAAHHLTSIGARVAVVDRRPLMTGSTPASTALLLYEIDTPLTELIERLGRDHAERAYHASRSAVESMPGLIADLDDPCDLTARPSVQYAPNERTVERLGKESEARLRAGLESHLIGRDQLRRAVGIDKPGALRSAPAFEVNPGNLTAALLRSAARRGATLIERTPVEISPALDGAHRVRIPTSAGGAITTSWVIVATGYETPEQCAPVAHLTDLNSTFAIATAPVEGEPWGERSLLWEAADPYLYLRTTPDGRVIIGGEDEPYANPRARDAALKAKSETLARRLRDLVPGLRVETEFAWAGTFASTKDGLPYIGAFPDWDRVLFALGFGGNGITFSLLAAQIIRDIVGGRANDHAELFRFGR